MHSHFLDLFLIFDIFSLHFMLLFIYELIFMFPIAVLPCKIPYGFNNLN